MTHGAFAPLILPCHCPNHDPPRPMQPTRSTDRPKSVVGGPVRIDQIDNCRGVRSWLGYGWSGAVSVCDTGTPTMNRLKLGEQPARLRARLAAQVVQVLLVLVMAGLVPRADSAMTTSVIGGTILWSLDDDFETSRNVSGAPYSLSCAAACVANQIE